MSVPKALESVLRPIDSAARLGRYQLVFGGDAEFACARWNGETWVFSNGAALGWEPESYDGGPGLRA